MVSEAQLCSINSIGSKTILGKDAVFVIKPCKYIHWGDNLNINSPNAKWHEYEALIVVTRLATMKLTWAGKERAKFAHDDVVNKVKSGRIRSLVDLYSYMSRHGNQYGMPIMLTQTKLERFIDA